MSGPLSDELVDALGLDRGLQGYPAGWQPSVVAR